MIWFRRESVVWSGALRLRPIKRSSESRNPSGLAKRTEVAEHDDISGTAVINRNSIFSIL